MSKPRIERIDGPESYQKALKMARFGRCDWLHWSDATGGHAARKTLDNMKAMIAAEPKSWVLITANDGIPMKGFDWLASNVLKQLEMGWA